MSLSDQNEVNVPSVELSQTGESVLAFITGLLDRAIFEAELKVVQNLREVPQDAELVTKS